MRVVFIVTGLQQAGAELMLFNLLAGMDRNRFRPAVVSLSAHREIADRFTARDIPVHFLNLKPGRMSLSGLKKLAAKLRELDPDIIHGWMYHGNIAASLASIIQPRFRAVLWSIHHSVHSLQSESLMTRLMIQHGALLARRARKVVYVSKASAVQHEALGYPQAKSLVIPNGFDCARFAPSVTAGRILRQSLGISEQALLIGMMGRFHPVKDHTTFFQAARQLRQIRPDVHFVLAGRHIHPDNPALTQIVRQLELDSCVHLLGERTDIAGILAGLDVACSASLSEAFPMTIGEAMACGIPCVVTDVGDCASLVGETGRVVPVRDETALASAWRELIAMPPETRIALGTAARQRVKSQFSLDSVVRRYESLYEQVMHTTGAMTCAG